MIYEPDQIIIKCCNCSEAIVFKHAKFTEWPAMEKEIVDRGFVLQMRRSKYTKRLSRNYYCKQHARSVDNSY